MKNIHVIGTNKPSRLQRFFNEDTEYEYELAPKDCQFNNGVHIYVISDEEIRDVRPHKGKWQLEKGQILNKFPDYLTDLSDCKLVVMTTDPTLIADGVQSIDDKFLEWFVKNPTCEYVEINKDKGFEFYEIISMYVKEEPKQETLDEAAEKYADFSNDYIPISFGDKFNETSKRDFIAGANYMAEKMYSKEEVMNMFDKFSMYLPLHYEFLVKGQLKKK